MNTIDGSKSPKTPKEDENELLKDLQSAYQKTNKLKHSLSHKKILLDLEQKIRKDKKKNKSVQE